MENPQLVINICFGVITFLAGWGVKVIFGLLNKIEDNHKENIANLQEENRKTQDDLVALALSIPEKYLRKDDFISFAERMDERFDKIDEKLDRLNK
tara:strand:+ start:11409 stop:11696 length:288 start_codon:yes stop_codon:yes gene_type:complete